MFQRAVLFAIGIVFLTTGVLAQNPSAKLPEYRRYYFVFRQIALLEQKAVAAEKRGDDGSGYRLHYQKFASLDDREMSQLNQIASDCLRDLAPLDDRVKELIAEARAKVQANKFAPGVSSPTLSATVKQIEASRDQIIRQAYARLLAAFGEAEFKRFGEMIDKSMHVKEMGVGASERGASESPTFAPEGGVVRGISMIQELDGEIRLYTATELDFQTALYYNAIVDGLIFNKDTGDLLSEFAAENFPIVELIVTAPALPATNYIGYGEHAVRTIFPGDAGYKDPFCFSLLPIPIFPGGPEVQIVGFLPGQCFLPIIAQQILILGITVDSISTPEFSNHHLRMK
jgi:hypothetical protein